MKSIAFRAVKGSNGYVRSSFVGNAAGSKSSNAWGMVIAASLLILTATFVGFLFINR
jgi:hypothetical protein